MNDLQTIVFRRANVVECYDFVCDTCDVDIDKLVKYKSYEPSLKCVSNLLGIDTRDTCIAFTITIPPLAKIPLQISRTMSSGRVKTETVKTAYKAMTNEQQVKFLIDVYIPHVVTPFLDRGIIVPELHKSGLIHMHIIAQDDSIKDEYDMRNLRCSVNQCLAVRNLRNKFASDYVMNNITYCVNKTPEGELEYMSKSRKDMNERGYPFWCFKNRITLN